MKKEKEKNFIQSLTDYKKDVLDIDTLNQQRNLQIHFLLILTSPRTQNKGNKTWEAAYFSMVPTVAALTILSKFQNDVKTSENKVVSFCHEKVGKVEVIQDAYAAIAIANTTNDLPGQEIEITAGVGGFSKADISDNYIGGQNIASW